MKSKLLMLSLVGLMLTGCKSEVDKCVEAGLDMVRARGTEVTEWHKYNGRLVCLKAQAGKD